MSSSRVYRILEVIVHRIIEEPEIVIPGITIVVTAEGGIKTRTFVRVRS